MKAEAFLTRCEKFKTTGEGTWIASCPAHRDRHPSMTIREAPDGRVLIHCHAGCSVESILAAVGMDFDALFPDKSQEHVRRFARPFNASDVIMAIADEAMLLMVVASDLKRGVHPTDETLERAILANHRIQEAVDYALGK